MNSAIEIMEIVINSLALHIVWSIDWETINAKMNVIILTAREMAKIATDKIVQIIVNDMRSAMGDATKIVMYKNVSSTA